MRRRWSVISPRRSPPPSPASYCGWTPARICWVELLALAVVGNDAAGHQPIPDGQHEYRADRGGDEAGALVGAVMAERLADPGGDEGADDPEHRGQDEARRIVRAR